MKNINMQWYYAEDDLQKGPISVAEFKTLVLNGRIMNNTLIWRAGMENWTEYRRIKKQFDFGKQIVQKFSPGSLRYGGFWIRAGAKTIDALIIAVISILISFLLKTSFYMVSIGLQIILSMTYTTWFIGKYAATPGKMVCGLKVIHADNSVVSYKWALVRYIAEWASTVFCIGYLMVVFDNQKQSLHDRICCTRVIFKT